MSSPVNRNPRRNFDDDDCCQTYCPCCPQCNCKCDCNCNCDCNCTKKKMIIPTFILSAIAFIFCIIEMITKVTDTDAFIEFKKAEKTTLQDYEKYKDEMDEILDIEDAENKFTLALFIISIFIFFIYLILLICFIYEKVCFANYNPRCKEPYYMIMMILNFIAVFANAMICFIFFSYRINSIDTYSDYPYFKNSDFKEKNDLNISLDIISAFCYLFCLIFHLIICYYLFREDGLCACCCSEFLNCINCCSACLRCLFCCCCCYDAKCCCDCNKRPPPKRPSYVIPRPSAIRPAVTIFPQNFIPVIPFTAQQRNSVNVQNQVYQESSQLRSYMNDDLRAKIERVCKNGIYDESYQAYSKCGLCKNNFRVREEITVLPCGHVYHKNCVYNWFISNKTCPEDGTVVFN